MTSGSRANSGSHGGSGNLYKTGVGTQTLSGALSYTGTTTVAAGTLNLQDTIGGAGSDYNGGNININGASTLRVSGLRYNFAGETFTFDSTGGGTIDAIASGAGGFVFMGNNTFATSGGAQNIISGTRKGSENQGFNLNGQTATFDVATGTDATSDLKVIGTIWNGGNVVKDGAGRMEIASTQQYSGTTTVNQGSLIVNGNISSSALTTVDPGATLAGTGTVGASTVNGTLTPGDGGIESLDFTSLTLNDTSSSLFEINTTGDAADLAIASAAMLFDGALTVSNIGAALANGDVFNLFDWGSASGTFDTVRLPALNEGLSWDQSQLYTDGTITVVPEPRAALLGGLGMLCLLRRRR